MRNSEEMRVGVVIEWRRIDHPWQEYSCRAVAVLPGAPAGEQWRLLHEEEGCRRYLAGTLAIALHPGETEGYRRNLSQRQPVVFVILRRAEGSDEPGPRPFHATVCPYEAQDYLDADDDIVEGVPMPTAITEWVRGFVATHHREVPFEKRKRCDAANGAAATGDEWRRSDDG